MARRQAFEFLRRMRGDPAVREQVAAAAPAGIAGLVAEAAALGHDFTDAELREAWTQEWAARAIAAGIFDPFADAASSAPASAQ